MACDISVEIGGDNMFPRGLNLQSWRTLPPPAPPVPIHIYIYIYNSICSIMRLCNIVNNS